MIIAIDGTAASGKGTLGRSLAQSLDLAYLDTGQLYRAVGVAADARDIDIDAAPASEIADIAAELDLSQPFGENLRTARAAELASKVAALPAVRAALLDKQRQFALHPPCGTGAILACTGTCLGFESAGTGFGLILRNFANAALSADGVATGTGFALPPCMGFTVAMTLPQRDFSVLSRCRVMTAL